MSPDAPAGTQPAAGPTDRIFEPTVDWIGNTPLSHGERDVPYSAADRYACLCGVRDFTYCPDEGGEGSVFALTIRPAEEDL